MNWPVFDAIIKVGGSLYDQPNLPANLVIWAALAGEHRLLFLPGGGPFAESVRAADARFQLSDSAAHWMAILAMEQYAYLLADLSAAATIVHDLGEAAAACAAKKAPILAPAALLRQVDPLPHSWQVTSDSIAAWLAGYSRTQRLVLLKSVAGIFQESSKTLRSQISREKLVGSEVVDPYFAQALPPDTDCWLIDGGQPDRLGELLQSGRTIGTQVLGG